MKKNQKDFIKIYNFIHEEKKNCCKAAVDSILLIKLLLIKYLALFNKNYTFLIFPWNLSYLLI